MKASKTNFLFDLKVAAASGCLSPITIRAGEDAGYPGSSDRLDNHLAGVLFLTFIEPDFRLFRKVELPVDIQRSANRSGRRLDSVALVIQLRAFHDATVLRKFGDVPDDLSAL
jgi:hypothetical protein